MPEARGVGTELAGALQRDGLGVERTHALHELVQLDHGRRIAREGGKIVAQQATVGCQVLQVVDPE